MVNMFFALYKLKIVKKIIFVFIQKAVIKCHSVNLCTLCVVSVAPFLTCLNCEMCIFRDLYLLFLVQMLALSKIMTDADS